ncbi:phosphopentomutase [Salinarimonas ramus]|uniref:Phosphopentomutase n=1 Tax=Salinarimonas ramus TaxID=690164 RepID=A0A917V5D8_9HYPH|nr:phosphopentomutase [Salinarimonas ramus]GGK39835.1 phosphopentomutase [Salinarimonas ramus]
MPRALVIVLDSVGIGGAQDAHAYGDEVPDTGSDTLGHIVEACRDGRGDRNGLRAGPLALPHLARLGLGLAHAASTGRAAPHPELAPPAGGPQGAHGYAVEVSAGKDTPSGHYEIMGCPVPFAWGYFPKTQPTFPKALTDALIAKAGLPGILGDKHANGMAIIEEYGAEHVRTGKPICYTSADSVFQIAAHEEHFGLERLYEVCAVARELVDEHRIGRVIARPFVGSPESGFTRTANRRDYATPPPADTLLDVLARDGRAIVSVGKIGDIFAHRATGEEVKGHGNAANLDAALAALARLPHGGLVFANLVDFDQEFGHRRDVPGYAAALEAFDRRVPEIEAALRPGDLVLVTADHGNDPTWAGTDHTREHVPVIAFGPGIAPRALGRRESFADMGASLAAHLRVAGTGHGRAFDL